MTVVKISEGSAEPDGSFVARVSIGEGAEYEMRVSDPAVEGTERRVRLFDKYEYLLISG